MHFARPGFDPINFSALLLLEVNGATDPILSSAMGEF